jgi:hypothetical protein
VVALPAGLSVVGLPGQFKWAAAVGAGFCGSGDSGQDPCPGLAGESEVDHPPEVEGCHPQAQPEVVLGHAQVTHLQTTAAFGDQEIPRST